MIVLPDIVLSKSFCVYTDVTQEKQPRVFYVGKGCQSRIKAIYRNDLHMKIMKKYGAVRHVVFETDDEQEAFQVEMKLIQEYRTLMNYEPGWWGANLTLGGTGMSGHKMSEEHRSIVSNAQKERWKNMSKREKYIDTNKARWTHERLAQHSLIAKERWSNPEERERASKAALKRWQDPDQIESKRASTKKCWSDPEYRAKQIAVRLGKKRPCKKCGVLGHLSKTCEKRNSKKML